jgi:hypothetical protein
MSKLTEELNNGISDLKEEIGLNFGVSIEKAGRVREYSLLLFDGNPNDESDYTDNGEKLTDPLPYKEFIRMIYGIRIGWKLKVNKTESIESVIQEDKEGLEEAPQKEPRKKKLPWE